MKRLVLVAFFCCFTEAKTGLNIPKAAVGNTEDMSKSCTKKPSLSVVDLLNLNVKVQQYYTYSDLQYFLLVISVNLISSEHQLQYTVDYSQQLEIHSLVDWVLLLMNMMNIYLCIWENVFILLQFVAAPISSLFHVTSSVDIFIYSLEFVIKKRLICACLTDWHHTGLLGHSLFS